jgi:hypothetical protein
MSTNITQFSWPASFSCTIVNDQLILPTIYNINISIDPESQSQLSVNTGFKKLRSFVDVRLQNSIFIFKENPLIRPFETIHNNQVVFPTEPYDYFVGCVLYKKLLAITEKYFQIEFITIDSLVGDHVQYTIGDPEESGLDLSGDFWWNKDTLDTGCSDGITWDDLNIDVEPKFAPKVIQGGLSEGQ